jgi:hypothetical protein
MTQEYLTRKIVTAWAEDRRGDLPEDAPEGAEGELIEGFAVKYEDGYTSWCPHAKFLEGALALGNIAHLPKFQQRLVAEVAELRRNTEGLNKFLTASVGKTAEELHMSARQLTLLNNQSVAMKALLDILDARIEDMSNLVGIAELFQPDPLLDQAPSAPLPETPALKGKLGRGDEWLHETLQRASETGDKARDFFGAWTGVNGPSLTAKMPFFPTKYNLFGMLQGQGHLSNNSDMTDTIGNILVKELHDADGKILEVTDQFYHSGNPRYVELIARTADIELSISVNRETAVATLNGHCPNGDPLPAGLVLFLSVTLHNANRRPAQ